MTLNTAASVFPFRGTTETIKDAPEIIEAIKESRLLKRQWEKYRNEYSYAKDIIFEDTVMVLYELMK
jgi:hypothetical protein